MNKKYSLKKTKFLIPVKSENFALKNVFYEVCNSIIRPDSSMARALALKRENLC